MMQLFLPGISALVFLLISVQRYLLICKPFGPKMTLFWNRMSFAIACGLAMLGTSPILGISGIRISEETFMDTNVTVHMCKFSVVSSLGSTAYFGFLFLTIIVCIVATICLYIPVLKELNISIKFFHSAISNNDHSKSENTMDTEMKSEQIEMKSNDARDASQIQLSNPNSSQNQHVQDNVSYSENCCDQSSHSTSPREQDGVKDTIKNPKGRKRPKRERVQRRLTIMFFLLILVFIISYIPPLVFLILTYTIENFKFIKLSETEAMVWIYARNVVLLNHVINPLIYGYYDLQFRKETISCFKRRVNICNIMK
jgi:hypothetical protein